MHTGTGLTMDFLFKLFKLPYMFIFRSIISCCLAHSFCTNQVSIQTKRQFLCLTLWCKDCRTSNNLNPDNTLHLWDSFNILGGGDANSLKC